MNNVLRVYDYSDSRIIKISILEPKLSDRYRYYYKYTIKTKRYVYNNKSFSILKFIKNVFNKTSKEKVEESKDEETTEVYENILAESCFKKNNSWNFGCVNIYKKDIDFFINDNVINLSNKFNYPYDGSTILTFHNKEGKVNSDLNTENVWINLDYSYKIEIVKIVNNNIITDNIYFLYKKDLEEFMEWIQKYLSKEGNLIIDDNTGKIIK